MPAVDALPPVPNFWQPFNLGGCFVGFVDDVLLSPLTAIFGKLPPPQSNGGKSTGGARRVFQPRTTTGLELIGREGDLARSTDLGKAMRGAKLI